MSRAVFSQFRPRAGLFGLGLALLLPTTSAYAEVKLPAIFGDHMVLQQNQANKVWGWADPGEEVAVEFDDDSNKTVKADAKGNWSVTLDPVKADGEPHQLSIAGKSNAIIFEDVLIGEVWICSGQSNMQWDLGAANDADLESLAANYPEIRFISVPQVGTQEPKNDFQGKWEVCTPKTARGFSAVGYLFGRQLHQTLGVPIGLIDDAWGGSACEAWIRRDILEKDEKYQPMMERWAAIEKSDDPRQKGLLGGNQRPANIYNGVLKPTIGYGIKGVIWYQGESNASRAYQYRDLFALMIKSWRDEWNIGDFPFYWVQLADFMGERAEPADSAWAELREAQTMTMDKLPHTGQAVIIDLGEAQDIHPRNKQDVAKRLARWALARDYGMKVPYQSPTYKGMEKDGAKLTLSFDHVGNGLKAYDVPEVKGFTIAGPDKVFHKATAQLVGTDKVEVTSKDVADPVAVRYGWADNPVVNLYSRAGLPVTPFRTDSWKGVTADAK